MNQRIFITGGASGLGRALAERYARDGWRVCIGDIHAARGEETVQALRAHGATAHHLRCDVTQEADLEAAAAWLTESWGGVDIVVNNAGVAIGGGIGEVPMADWAWIVDVNLLGVVRGCRVFTPVFRRQGGGRFVNIASMAGLIHPPLMSAYNATKAGVVALSETLRVELAPDKIAVSVVCPSFFRTNLMDTLRMPDQALSASSKKFVTEAKEGADEVAARVHRGIARGQFHVLPHGEGEFAWLVKRLVPSSLFAGAMGMIARRVTRDDKA